MYQSYGLSGHMTLTFPQHIRAILILGVPLMGGHFAQFAIGMTDTIMLGWYSVEALAAITLASSYFFVVFMLGSGFSQAVMPLVASYAAEADDIRTRRTTRMGLWLSFLFSVIMMPLMWWSGPILSLMGQEPEVSAGVQAYLRIAGWGLIPALGVMVFKSYLAALERTQSVLWITVAAAVSNGLINYVLIFGNWGAPEMGLQGAAIASLSVQCLSLIGCAIYALYSFPDHRLFQRVWRPDWEALRDVFRLGVPIGLTSLAEVALFAGTAVMMGWLGTIALAAHGIALTLAGATFMLHLGLSNAATIRAGNAMGRKDRAGLKRGAWAILFLSFVMALLTIIMFVTIPAWLISLFVDEAEPDRAAIITVGVVLLQIAGLFQLVDAAQVMALGFLRGVRDTRIPMIIAIVSYWCIGMPSSYILGFVVGWGGAGVWLGLVIGLAVAGVLMMYRFWNHAVYLVEDPAAA